jgi:hypothetical protein
MSALGRMKKKPAQAIAACAGRPGRRPEPG